MSDEAVIAGGQRSMVAWGAALGGAVAAAGAVYLLSGVLKLGQDWPLLVAGPIIGGLVRLVAKGVDHSRALVIAALAILAAVGGFVAAETLIWEPFIFEAAIRRILSLIGILLLAVTAYLGYVLALRR